MPARFPVPARTFDIIALTDAGQSGQNRFPVGLHPQVVLASETKAIASQGLHTEYEQALPVVCQGATLVLNVGYSDYAQLNATFQLNNRGRYTGQNVRIPAISLISSLRRIVSSTK